MTAIINWLNTPMFVGEQKMYVIAAYIFAGLIGLVIGSFLNVVIYRVPNGMSIAMPPSHCPNCDYKLKWYDNIPVLSYIILGGKCRSCKQKISFRYTVVELLNMLLWILCVFVFVDNKGHGELIRINEYFNRPGLAYAVIAMITCSVLLCVAFIDLEHTFIPDRFQVILGVLGVLAIVCNLLGFNDGITWLERVIGALGSLLLFLIIYFGGKLAFKKEAMGIGDIKLVTVVGLILGWKNMIVALFIGFLVGAVVMVIAKRVRNDEAFHEYPFGPFLALGMLIALFFGSNIINAYLSLIHI